MKIDFGQGEKEIIVSVHTLVVYENEFHSDMIQDAFGRMAIRKNDKSDDEIVVMDFRDLNWFQLTKVLWACIKAADDDTAPFVEWSKTVEDFDMNALAATLMPELQRKLFRSGAAASE